MEFIDLPEPPDDDGGSLRARATSAVATVRDRIVDTPGALADLGEQALDLAVRRAVQSPLDVHGPDDVARVLRSRSLDSQGPMGAVLGWLGGRLATRVLRIGRRFSIPVRVLLTAAPPVIQALRHGAFEVHVLASYVVQRMRLEGLTADQRTVQRLAVAAYLRPDQPVVPAGDGVTGPGASHGCGSNAPSVPIRTAPSVPRIVSRSPISARSCERGYAPVSFLAPTRPSTCRS